VAVGYWRRNSRPSTFQNELVATAIRETLDGQIGTGRGVTLSFLALGDSYTIGEGVAERDCWPAQLVARLRLDGTGIDDSRLIARTGWTSDEILGAIRDRGISGQFDLVTLLAGVNDQFRGLGVEQYRQSFGRLLQAAVGLAKLPSHLIVLSIPDWSVTPFATGRDRTAIAREIDAFNDVNRSAAASARTRYLDVTPSSRQASRNADLIAADGLHPSATMYSMWVDLLLPVVRGALGAPQGLGG
jgi:lysophospholipase L1-like esterase